MGCRCPSRGSYPGRGQWSIDGEPFGTGEGAGVDSEGETDPVVLELMADIAARKLGAAAAIAPAAAVV